MEHQVPGRSASPSTKDRQIIAFITDQDKNILPLLQWVISLPVLAFVNEVPELRHWFPAQEADSLGDISAMLRTVSGLAILFFSVRPRDKKSLFRSADGAVWTHMVRCVFASMVLTGSNVLFRADTNPAPECMKSFLEPADVLNTRVQPSEAT